MKLISKNNYNDLDYLNSLINREVFININISNNDNLYTFKISGIIDTNYNFIDEELYKKYNDDIVEYELRLYVFFQ